MHFPKIGWTKITSYFGFQVAIVIQALTKIGHAFLSPLLEQQAYEGIQCPANKTDIAVWWQSHFFPQRLFEIEHKLLCHYLREIIYIFSDAFDDCLPSVDQPMFGC